MSGDPLTLNPSYRSSRADRVQKIVSPGGIAAWLVEDQALPIVALNLAFVGGATQDQAGKSGTATMLSALLDEGADDMDAQAFHQILEEKAVELHFSADRDHFTGQMRSLTRNLGEAFTLLGKALNRPRFDQEAISRIAGQISAGLKRELHEPESLAAKSFRQHAFGTHPYHLPIRGTLESIPTIGRDDFVAMHRCQFTRNGLKIAAVGAINAKQLGNYLDATFGDLPASNSLQEFSEAPFLNMGSQHFVDLDVSQSTIRFGRPGIARQDPDFIAALVVNHILGGGTFTARLFREVRERRGLAYSVYSQLVYYKYSAFLMGSTTTKNERAKEALEVIQSVFIDLSVNGPTQDELVKAKSFLIGSYDLRFDTSTKIAHHLAHLQLDGYDTSFLDLRNDLIDEVDLARIKRVGARLLGDGQLLVSMAGKPVMA